MVHSNEVLNIKELCSYLRMWRKFNKENDKRKYFRILQNRESISI